MLLLMIIAAVVVFIYWKCVRVYAYWTDRGVKQGKQTIFFGDCIGLAMKTECLADMVMNVYNKFPNNRYSGIYFFMNPRLLLRDPELIKQLIVKDFDHFTDHRNFVPDGCDTIWSRNLFFLKGEKWKEMRSTLSPAFTSSKMRLMFSLISDCAENLTTYFVEKSRDVQEIELKDSFTRLTNDVIATCAFGVECDSLRNRNNEFFGMGKKATDFTGLWAAFCLTMFTILPKLAQLLRLTFIPAKVVTFFHTIVKATVKLREEKNIIRPDIIHLLMEAKKGRLRYEESSNFNETGFATVEESEIGKAAMNYKKEITTEDVTAQALVFFFAGFEPVSTMMSFMGYELAVNPDIQERLQREIDETLMECNGKMTYETLNKMKYLDMVTSECLRKWPSASFMDRSCVKDYTIQPTSPDEVPVHIKRGDVVWYPIRGLHHDPQYYPNPEKFDPERFNDENKQKIKPFTYLPFGVGPRNCIGSRFALMEVKIVFFHLLSKFDIVVVDKTPIPIVLVKSMGFNLQAEGGIWVGLKQRKLE